MLSLDKYEYVLVIVIFISNHIFGQSFSLLLKVQHLHSLIIFVIFIVTAGIPHSGFKLRTHTHGIYW